MTPIAKNGTTTPTFIWKTENANPESNIAATRPRCRWTARKRKARKKSSSESGATTTTLTPRIAHTTAVLPMESGIPFPWRSTSRSEPVSRSARATTMP